MSNPNVIMTTSRTPSVLPGEVQETVASLEDTREKVDLSHCYSVHSLANKGARVLWGVVWLMCYRPSPKVLFVWRRFLLRLFGARIGAKAFPAASAKIWAPWNLEMGNHSCLGENVDCYCVDKVIIESNVTVSQYCFLCTASHDYQKPNMPLITAPIRIREGAWLAADVFVGPGVNIGYGAVVGARSSVYSDIEPWLVVAGNPARFVKKRQIQTD